MAATLDFASSDGEYHRVISAMYTVAKAVHGGGGLDDISVPEILVIGGTSKGKSSLLEYLSGVPLPSDPERTTVCPAMVRMRPCEAGACPRITVDGEETAKARVAERILARQSAILQAELESASRARAGAFPGAATPGGDASHTQSAAGDASASTATASAAAAASAGGVTAESKAAAGAIAVEPTAAGGPRPARIEFSAKTITIESWAENNPNLYVVDLPGLVSAGTGNLRHTPVWKIVSDRARSSRAVILVVWKAHDSEDNEASLAIAREVDPTMERTLVVNTHCDVKETTAKTKSLQEHIRKAAAAFAHAEALGTLVASPEASGEVPHRAHFVQCKADNDAVVCEADEAKLFRTLAEDIPGAEHVTGRRSLIKRLEAMLAERAMLALPAVHREVTERLSVELRRQQALGLDAPSSESIVQVVVAKLHASAWDLRPQLHSLMEAKRYEERLLEAFEGVVHDEDQMREVVSTLVSSYDTPATFEARAIEARLEAVSEAYRAVLGPFGRDIARTTAARLRLAIAAATEGASEDLTRCLWEDAEENFLPASTAALEASFARIAKSASRCFTRHADFVGAGDFGDVDVCSLAAALTTVSLKGNQEEQYSTFLKFMRASALPVATPRSVEDRVTARALAVLAKLGRAQHQTIVDWVSEAVREEVHERLTRWISSAMTRPAIREAATESVERAAERHAVGEAIGRLRESRNTLKPFLPESYAAQSFGLDDALCALDSRDNAASKVASGTAEAGSPAPAAHDASAAGGAAAGRQGPGLAAHKPEHAKDVILEHLRSQKEHRSPMRVVLNLWPYRHRETLAVALMTLATEGRVVVGSTEAGVFATFRR